MSSRLTINLHCLLLFSVAMQLLIVEQCLAQRPACNLQNNAMTQFYSLGNLGQTSNGTITTTSIAVFPPKGYESYTGAAINFCKPTSACNSVGYACLTSPTKPPLILCNTPPLAQFLFPGKSPQAGANFSCSVGGQLPVLGFIGSATTDF
jgi:hypothetical protein